MKFFGLDQAGIGRDLKRAREHLGLTLKEVSEKSGVAPSHIWNLENGEKEMSLDKFFVLCSTLGIPTGQMISDNTQVDYGQLFEFIFKSLKSHNPLMDQKLLLFYANYYAACSVVILHKLLTPGTQMLGADFSYPTDGIKEAFSLVDMKLRVMSSLKRRKEYLEAMQTDPIAVVGSLGLGTAILLSEYVTSLGKRETSLDLAAWKPVSPTSLDDLLSEIKDVIDFDVTTLSKAFDEVKKAGGIDAFLKRTKRKEQKKRKV